LATTNTVAIDTLNDGALCKLPDSEEWDGRLGRYERLIGMTMRKVKHNYSRAHVLVLSRVREIRIDGVVKATAATYLDIAPATQVVPLFEGGN